MPRKPQPVVDIASGLSVRKVALTLGVDSRVVKGHVATGELIAVDVTPKGRTKQCLRIMPDELEAFLRRRSTVKPVAPKRVKRVKRVPEPVTDYIGD